MLSTEQQEFINAGGMIKFGSALSPLVWLDIIIGVPALFIGMYFLPEYKVALLLVTAMLVGLTIFVIFYLLVKDSGKLMPKTVTGDQTVGDENASS